MLLGEKLFYPGQECDERGNMQGAPLKYRCFSWVMKSSKIFLKIHKLLKGEFTKVQLDSCQPQHNPLHTILTQRCNCPAWSIRRCLGLLARTEEEDKTFSNGETQIRIQTVVKCFSPLCFDHFSPTVENCLHSSLEMGICPVRTLASNIEPLSVSLDSFICNADSFTNHKNLKGINRKVHRW